MTFYLFFTFPSKLLDVGLETYPYPPESEETEDATYPRIGVTLRLLDSVIFFEEPVVARWDSAGTVSLQPAVTHKC